MTIKEDLYFSDEAHKSMWYAINRYFGGLGGLGRLARSCRIEVDDLTQVAELARWRACLSYDPAKWKLGSLVISYVRNDLRWHIRNYGSLIKLRYDNALTDRYDFEPLEGHVWKHYDTIAEKMEVEDLYNRIYAISSDAQQKILDNLIQGYSKAETSRILGIRADNVSTQMYQLKRKCKGVIF